MHIAVPLTAQGFSSIFTVGSSDVETAAKGLEGVLDCRFELAPLNQPSILDQRQVQQVGNYCKGLLVFFYCNGQTV